MRRNSCLSSDSNRALIVYVSRISTSRFTSPLNWIFPESLESMDVWWLSCI